MNSASSNESPAAPTRFLPARPPLGTPPAVWAAFARASAWKTWLLIAELGVIAILLLTVLKLASRDPDVVTIGPEGTSTYLGRSVAGEALLRFLAEQKGQPPDVAVVHFTREFLEHFLAFNSSTIRAAWGQALQAMAPPLKAKVERDSKGQKLVETLEHAQVRTDLIIDAIDLVERSPALLHVRAGVTRTQSRLSDASTPTTDALAVDLVLAVVSRSPAKPDGLEIVEVRVRPKTIGSGANPAIPNAVGR